MLPLAADSSSMEKPVSFQPVMKIIVASAYLASSKNPMRPKPSISRMALTRP